MDTQDVRSLVDYHYWARDRVMAPVMGLTPDQYTRDLGNSFRSIRDTLVHVYSAEWVWLARWKGISPTAHRTSAEFPDQVALDAAWREHERELRAFVDGIGERALSAPIEYKSLDGRPYRHLLGPMLQHVVNHATYHRGQITTMLRQLELGPPANMDLIAFLRERDAEPVAR